MALPTKFEHYSKGTVAIIAGVVLIAMGSAMATGTLMYPWIIAGAGVILWGGKLWHEGLTTKQSAVACPYCGTESNVLETAEKFFCKKCQHEIDMNAEVKEENSTE